MLLNSWAVSVPNFAFRERFSKFELLNPPEGKFWESMTSRTNLKSKLMDLDVYLNKILKSLAD